MNQTSELRASRGRVPSQRGWLVSGLIGLSMAAALLGVGTPTRTVRAQTNRFVSALGGDDLGGTNDCTTPDQPCATIQHAIDVSGAGDLIELLPGTYSEHVSVTADVTIQGDGSAASIVSGGNTGSVFTINGGVSATITSLTITDGAAQASSNTSGGGVLNNGTLTIVNSTVNGNTASNGPTGNDGGGIFNTGSLTVINSTISGNTAGAGGGIFNMDTGTATLVNCTIANNTATTGGGIVNDGTLNLRNTIVAGSGGGDCVNSGSVATNVNNLIQDGSCSPAVSGDPKLGPLQDNGGPTFTHALLTGSPAIDAGDDSVLGDPLNLSTDQRGIGFARLVCAHVDIGAYEFAGGLPPIVTCPGDITAAAPPGQSSASVSFTVTAADACGPLSPVCMIDDMVITSPFVFPVGVTFVTCSVIDSAGLFASCSFAVSVSTLDVCIQDDSTRDTLRFNSTTGQYQFTRCSTGFTLSGTGVLTRKGTITTLQHNAVDRKVAATIDNATHRASASIQILSPKTTFTIADRNTLNNTCVCQ